jgi:hypothetical protein
MAKWRFSGDYVVARVLHFILHDFKNDIPILIRNIEGLFLDEQETNHQVESG